MLTRIAPTEMSVERFQNTLKEVCGSFQTKVKSDQKRMQGQVYSETRAGFDFAHVAKDISSICRTQADINRDASENFFLIVQEEGRAIMTQNETARMLEPGDMMLIDSAVPSEFSFFGKFGRQLSVHLPRSEMVQRFGGAAVGGIYLPRTDSIAMALGATLAKAFEPADCTEQSQYLREAMFGLVGALLFERNQRSNANKIESDVGGANLLQRGQAYIDRLFKSNELSVPVVASDLGVSPRQLQRAFSLLNTTPSEYLLKKRLEYSCQLLLERQNFGEHYLVSSIAYEAGFNDVSYFNRLFRKHFDCSPGQYGAAENAKMGQILDEDAG